MNKSGIGKHWYNNGEKEGYFLECPEGWVKGRLPVKDSTRQKHRDNNGMHKLSDEAKQGRSKKLHEAYLNQTEEQRKHKSEAISKAKKGKNLGRTPWNKGLKSTQSAWNKGLKQPKTEDQIKAMIEKRDKTIEERGSVIGKPKGTPSWNKGKHYILEPDVKSEMVRKMCLTKELNGTFNTSKPEEEYLVYLQNKYGKEDVISQYTDERYPFRCDFYIKSLDLFIELNISWTHGGHPFDENNEEDLNLLDYWRLKSEESQYYKNAIETWTIRDVKKRYIAKENNLNYKIYYTLEDAYNE